jgi:hypothetical protein
MNPEKWRFRVNGFLIIIRKNQIQMSYRMKKQNFSPNPQSNSHGNPGHIYVVSLLVASHSTCSFGEVIRVDGCSTLIRHGLYSYSIYSARGGWVLISPIPGVIESIIHYSISENLIWAAASMEQQWVIQKGRTNEAAEALSRMITPQLPRYHTLPKSRRIEISIDIEKLCSIFIEREKKIIDFTPQTVPVDQHFFPDKPRDSIDSSLSNQKKIPQSRENVQIKKHLLELLTYYWESVFIIWWKGFW